MTSTEPIWMTRQAYTRLAGELATLRSRPNVEMGEDVMDYDDETSSRTTLRDKHASARFTTCSPMPWPVRIRPTTAWQSQAWF